MVTPPRPTRYRNTTGVARKPVTPTPADDRAVKFSSIRPEVAKCSAPRVRPSDPSHEARKIARSRRWDRYTQAMARGAQPAVTLLRMAALHSSPARTALPSVL